MNTEARSTNQSPQKRSEIQSAGTTTVPDPNPDNHLGVTRDRLADLSDVFNCHLIQLEALIKVLDANAFDDVVPDGPVVERVEGTANDLKKLTDTFVGLADRFEGRLAALRKLV